MLENEQQAFHDPNKSKEKRFAFDQGKRNLKDKLICKYCHAVYEEHHWRKFDNLNPKYINELKETICPACHEIQGHVSDGVLHITGTFLKEHKEEITNTILNVGQLAIAKDILNRIERIEDKNNKITIYTTKNQLAVRIAKKLHSSYKGGKLDIAWSKDDKPVEISWHKDLTS